MVIRAAADSPGRDGGSSHLTTTAIIFMHASTRSNSTRGPRGARSRSLVRMQRSTERKHHRTRDRRQEREREGERGGRGLHRLVSRAERGLRRFIDRDKRGCAPANGGASGRQKNQITPREFRIHPRARFYHVLFESTFVPLSRVVIRKDIRFRHLSGKPSRGDVHPLVRCAMCFAI
jgi:hypothetical protein